MIKKLNKKNIWDLVEFLQEFKDYYQDFFITRNKDRIFLNRNTDLIKKLLIKQEIYGNFDNKLNGIVMVYKEKGFRAYLKFIGEIKAINRLLKVLQNNLNGIFYIKLKKDNPIIKSVYRNGFKFSGGRGREILLSKNYFRPKEINLQRNKDE